MSLYLYWCALSSTAVESLHRCADMITAVVLQWWCVDILIHHLPLMLMCGCASYNFAVSYCLCCFCSFESVVLLLSSFCHFSFMAVLTKILNDEWCCWVLPYDLTNARTHEHTNRRTDGRTNKRTFGHTNVQTYELTDFRTNELTNIWTFDYMN